MIRRVPLAVRVPAVVIVFMAAVAIFVSERVLTRLQDAQVGHLDDLAAVYLNGLAPSLVDPVVREDVWEVFDILDRAGNINAGLKPAETVVAAADGRVLASSDPRVHPSWSALPSSFLEHRTETPTLVARDEEGRAVSRRDLSAGGQVVGSVHATFDMTPMLEERRSVLLALIGTNAILTLLLAVAAWLTVRHMMKPVGVLTSRLEAGAVEPVEPIPAETMRTAPAEFQRLFGAFNNMAEAVAEREALARRLADEEKLASLGRLASGMAHEINNPLGGLFNAIDTLKQHGQRTDVRRRTLDLIERGLKGIRDVVRATLVVYRSDRGDGDLRRMDVDDLRHLIEPEIRPKRLSIRWVNEGYDDVPVSPSAVRQVLLNLLLNACEATPPEGTIIFTAGAQEALFIASVQDQGPGLPRSARDVLEGHNDHVASETGTGLGLWMVRRIINEVGGAVSVDAAETGGTIVRIAIPFSHREGLANVA